MTNIAPKTLKDFPNNIEQGHRALRKGRASLAGQIYFLTTATMYRRPIFRDFQVSNSVCKALHQPWLWRDSKLVAWVLMPDHWHGLVQLGSGENLSTLVGRFKAITARAVPEHARVNGWLWGRGFHERALRTDEGLRDTARYLIGNPLRAGLVEDIGLYPYWNAAWLGQSTGNSCLI